MLQRAAGNAYSWWWASHIRTKQSKWLEQNLQDMEEKVHSVMTLVSEDGDSFAKRAEMYYKKRPEIITFVEEAYRAYRALAERYDHISTELQNANNTIAYVFPEQVQMAMEDEDDIPSPRFLKKLPAAGEPPKGNIPKVPKIPKEIKGMFQSATKKLQPKKSIKVTTASSSPAAPKPTMSKPEAFKHIDKLQKQVLALQTEKEFVKSSYENGLAKYWEIDQQIREIQDKACSLQDEFGAETVIDDDEARLVMTSAALKSCQETLVKLEEKQEKSAEEAKKERKRIKEAKEKLKSLLNHKPGEIDGEKGKEEENNFDFAAKEVAEEEEKEELRALQQQRQEIEVLREKIKKHFEASADSSLTVSEMAEKIDELVNKVVGLEAAVSSQSALIERMKAETDELNSEIQSLECDKDKFESGETSLNGKVEEMERKLEGIQEMNENIENQSTNLQTNFMEAKCNLDHLYDKLDSVKPDEEVQTPPVHQFKKAPKFESSQQQPFVKGKNIRNAVKEFDNSVKQDKEKSQRELKQQQVADEIRQAREARESRKKVRISEKKKKKDKPKKDKKSVEEITDVKQEVEQVAEQVKNVVKDVRTEEQGYAVETTNGVVNRGEEIGQDKKQEEHKPGDSVFSGDMGDTRTEVEIKEQDIGSLLEDDMGKGIQTQMRDDRESLEDSKAISKQISLKKVEKLGSGTQEKVEATSNVGSGDEQEGKGRKDADVNIGDQIQQVQKPDENFNRSISVANKHGLGSLLVNDPHEVQYEEKQNDNTEDSSDERTVAKQKSLKKLEMLSAEAQEKVAAAAVADVDVDAQENATIKSQDDFCGETREKTAATEALATMPTTIDDNSVQTQDNAAVLKSESEDDEPDWKQLFLKGVENREQVLLAEYTTILRSYKEIKKKLTESESNGGDNLLDITIQLKELRAANAKKDEQIRMLKKRLSLLQQDNEDKLGSPFTTDDILQGLNLDLDVEISPIEERFRSSIDEVLEENLDFWMRFSTTFQQVQQFETEVKDLQSELSELEEKLGKQEGSSHGKYSLKSDAKPLYKHLREIHAELTIWIEKGMLLKDELKGRFSALCEIQDEIKEALKESAEDEEFKFTSYQAAKFQGEILNMKQENNKVADELQAGLDHVTTLQLEAERTLARLNEEFKLSGSKNRQNIQLQHSESRSRVPLRSFIFGVKQKKQKHSIFAAVHPVLHRKYNGLRSGLNL
ncbi:unnamed protein product [Linum tenue]|uniref:NAB domain-containing protein n=1 Tax=Linum tenue TaxID=586396 RepID=A0AAV0PTR5_9ROSI|nr:unnamed protein product [Linum tenue]